MHSTDLVMRSKHESWKINIEFQRPQQREDLQLPGWLKQNLAAFLVCKEMASHTFADIARQVINIHKCTCVHETPDFLREKTMSNKQLGKQD